MKLSHEPDLISKCLNALVTKQDLHQLCPVTLATSFVVLEGIDLALRRHGYASLESLCLGKSRG
jgi:hypothetical protein